MEAPEVSLVGCPDYEGERVEESVTRAFDLLGGAESIAGRGESVFIKVNAVIAARPDSGVVTNPAVVKAVVRQFQKVTDRVMVGDSPGGPFSQVLLKRVYEKTGLAAVARETGAELAMNTGTVDAVVPDGKMVKRLTLCRSMLEVDRLVSVSKFKTHRFMNVTGPIKNLFGCVPGMNKFVYHSRYEDEREFADFIVDVCMAARPSFHVVDAVEIMHGGGATSGDVGKMGIIAAGRSAFALEPLVMELAGLSADQSKPLAAAIGRGLSREGTGWLNVHGDDIESLKTIDFRLPGKNVFSERIPAMLVARFNRAFTVMPRPLPDECTGCGTCVEVCPREAITIEGGVARVDSKKCIRCFCCEELCEHGAVGIRKPFMMRFTGKRDG